MRNFILYLLIASLAASCTGGVRVDGRLEGAKDGSVIVRVLDGAVLKSIDTVKVSASGDCGKYVCRVPVSAGEPEFVYLYYGDKQVASLILCKGDKVRVSTDTLGTLLSLSGSPESAVLHEADSAFAAFTARTRGLEGSDYTRAYVDFYRESVAFAMKNARSLAVVPVLYRKIPSGTLVFSQATDGLIFSSIADSLAISYPDSRYIRMLRKDAERRQKALDLSHRIGMASETAFPEIELPDTQARLVKLSETEAPLVLLYFWSPSAEEKMFNLDALKPLYEDFHARGLEIFAVALDPDKAEWAATVKRQGLDWINVCDTRAAASPLVGLYGIAKVPMVYFIKNGQIDPDAKVSDAATLRAYVTAALK